MAKVQSTKRVATLMEAYKSYLTDNSLKFTKQREVIVEEFFRKSIHLSAEELFKLVQKQDSKIGLASIYRTLGSLVDAGLAVERCFLDKTSVYEYNDPHEHHDHLICMRCHHIFEFENEEIEKLQETVAKGLGFTLTDHRLELYGICNKKDCKYLVE